MYLWRWILAPIQVAPSLAECARAFADNRPWRIEPSSPPATWTIEEYTIGDLVSVRPYRGSFEPVGEANA